MNNTKETGQKLKLSYTTVFKYIKTGKIKAVRIGKKWFVSDEEIERILKEGIY